MTSPADSLAQPRQFPLRLADFIGIPCLVSVLLLLSFLRSRHTMFSADEIMTLFVLRQPTFHAVLQTWRFGIDSSGVWFYVFGRPWISLFGASEIALRMYSATGIAIAATLIWITARRFYAFLPVAGTVSFVFAATHALRWQLAYGRTYGIFMAAAALVVYLLFRGEQETGQPPLFVLGTFAAYTLLMGSHILGVLYVTTFLATQFVLDRRSGRFRPWLYLAAAASAIVLLFSRENIKTTAALGKPTFWTVRPTFKDLVTFTGLFDHWVTAAMVFLFLITFFHLHLARKRMPVYILLLAFALLNIAYIIRSYLTTSIYVDRYLLPFAFAAILILCELLTQLGEIDVPFPALRHSLPLIVLVVAVAVFFLPRLQKLWFPLPNYTAGLAAALPPNLPIVDADDASFVEMEFYQHDSLHRRLLNPIDWTAATAPEAVGGISGPRELYNLKVEGYYPADILPTAQILARNRDFTLISGAPNVWLQRRILRDPAYTVTNYRTFVLPLEPPLDIYIVHAKANTQPISDIPMP